VLADTVGFIQRLPTQLVAAFRGTLEEVVHADLLLHVVDASHPDWQAQARVVRDVLESIGAGDRPVLMVFNKADRLTAAEVARLAAEYPDAVIVSAIEERGLDNLGQAIARRLPEPWVHLRLRLPYNEGRLLAQIHAEGRVVSERYTATGILVDAEVPGALAVQLRPLRRPARDRRAAAG
jgi:GTP-binding protein HflX